MKAKFTTYNQKCIKCKRYKRNTVKYGKFSGFIEGRPLFTDICSDIFGSFPGQDFNDLDKQFLLSLTDIFSRYTKVYIYDNIRGKEVVEALND